MVKQKKKRNKVYTGVDASVARPVITRIHAVKRNKVQQWWFDKKKIAKPVLIASGVAIVILWLLIELIHVLSGNGA
ncbi:MAG: hypothetical protein JWP06_823 [Candidatus Saccharibacteria bacterium]|nr:hypothetical protein [Candidatus Saccharibacteria bacterium]